MTHPWLMLWVAAAAQRTRARVLHGVARTVAVFQVKSSQVKSSQAKSGERGAHRGGLPRSWRQRARLGQVPVGSHGA